MRIDKEHPTEPKESKLDQRIQKLWDVMTEEMKEDLCLTLSRQLSDIVKFRREDGETP